MKKKSHFDFKKFLDENPDPLGIEKTGLKEYTIEEVAKHNAPPSIWTIYNGFVYDITMYIEYHPGGTKILESIYGKDMTAAYNKFHSYVRIDNFLGKFKIGYIKKEKSKFLSCNNNNNNDK